MDRGAWRAAFCRVTQSWTQLKRLSMHACIEEQEVIFNPTIGPKKLYLYFETMKLSNLFRKKYSMVCLDMY